MVLLLCAVGEATGWRGLFVKCSWPLCRATLPLSLTSQLRQGKSLSLSAIKALIPPGINMGNDCSQRGFATARDELPLMFSGHRLH